MKKLRKLGILCACLVTALLCLGTVNRLLTLNADAASLSTPQGYNQELYDRLCAGLRERRDSIDLRDGGFTTEELDATFSMLIVQEPDLFYVSGSYRYGRYENGAVTTMTPEYLYPKDQIPTLVADWEARVAEILALAEEDWTDMEKALFFHDYICDTFAYDDDLVIGDAYTFLLEGEGVCQAYTLLYDKLLTECGIPVYSVISDQLNHVWNQIKLGDAFYHVDVTWDDDDAPAGGGMASHKYFLLSTDALYGLRPASDMIAPAVCNSHVYDNASLHSINSVAVFCQGNWYGIKDGALTRLNLTTGATVHVLTLPTEWTATSNTYYPGSYSSLYRYGNLLIFNTPTELRYYNPASNTAGLLQAVGGFGNPYLFGFSLSGHTVTYSLTDSPTKKGAVSLTADARALDLTVRYTVEGIFYTEQAYQKGDLLDLPDAPFTFRHEVFPEALLVTKWKNHQEGELLMGSLDILAVVDDPENATLYTVTWIIDGVSHTDKYVKGEMPVCALPTDKAADADSIYTFAGWSPAVAPVTGDVAYTATYSTARNYYLVTFVTPLGSDTVRYGLGETPAMPIPPEKESSDQYTYVFSEWRLTEEAPNGDLTYTAVYEPQKQYKYSASYFVSAVDGFSMKDSLTATYQTLRALRTVALSVNPAGEGVAEALDLLEQYVAQYDERVEAANEGNERVVEQTFAHFGLEDTSELVALLPSPCGIKRREDGECL